MTSENLVTVPEKCTLEESKIMLHKHRIEKLLVVNKEGKLKITPVEVLFRDVQYAYITKGLSPGDTIVVTSLSRVVDGADLQLRKGINE